MSAIRNFFHYLWRGLDGLRRVLHLLLLLLIFGIIVGALRTSIPKLPTQAALVVRPEGRLVEQLSGEPIERAIDQAQGMGDSQTLLRDVVDAIRAAKSDARIKALYLDFDAFEGGGQPTLEEFARAVREFRASGKKVVAFGQIYLQDGYYVAASADEIYVDPLGFVLIDGYDRYRMFYKDALDKVGVDVNIFRVGAYKSAVEPYVRTDMSPEDREESTQYLGSLWDSWQRAVVGARKLPAGAITSYVASLPQALQAAAGDGAKVALDAKLVTAVKARADVEDRLIELAGLDEENDTFKSVDLRDYVRVLRAEERIKSTGTPRVGVIVASGEILDGSHSPGTIGGESTSELIRDARLDDDVKAVVLRIDSPGGSVTASEQIYRELKLLRADGKPLVVSMGDYAASGGYYIAAPADEIWASPATVTGSIGIFAMIPTVDRTLAKLGITVDGVGTTPLSGQLRLDRPLGADAKTLLQSTIEHGYEEFLARVADARDKTRDQVNEIAQGRVWTGVDAKRLGLVDQLGSVDDAIKAAAARAKLGKDYQVDYIEPEMSWAQELAMQVKVRFAQTLVGGDSRVRSLERAARKLDPLAREVERWSRFSAPNHLYAYCFCAVD